MTTAGTPTGIRIKDYQRPTHAIVTMSNRLTHLIEAAEPLQAKALEARLDATAAQLHRIIAQLDVMRTVLIVEGDAHIEVARAYADVCEDRLVAHAIYIGEAHRARA